MYFFSERSLRTSASLGATAALFVGALVVTSPAHSVTLAAPGSLSASAGGSSTPVLSWEAVKGATAYDVQADDDPSFGSPNFGAETANTRSVPTSHLPTGVVHWRVRATSGRDASSWTKSQVTVNPSDVPSPTHPANGSVLEQPRQQPLLRWTSSRGATSYTVQLDGDQDLIGSTSYTTKSTSFVIPNALAAGDWYWRVIANKSSAIISQPSPTMSFIVGALDVPQLDKPEDTLEEIIEDVRLDWHPVPGAATYDLQVALDPDFVNYAYTATGLRGTAFSPPTTLNNDEFWWRVRAVDAAGVATPWRESQYNFKRQWLDQAVPSHPLGTAMAPGLQDTDSTYFSWTPAQHATHYEVEVADNIGFNGAASCTRTSSSSLSTASITFAPRFTGSPDCLIPATTNPDSKIVYWWRVRPMDLPYGSDGLPGAWSTPQAFYRSQRLVEGVAPNNEAMMSGWATGLKVSMSGKGAKTAGTGCVSTPSVGYPTSSTYVRPSVCNMGATPVLSWDRMPGISRYVVWFAQDENFTTTEIQPIGTSNTMLSLDFREKSEKIALPESQSGRPYYWHVQACRTDGYCSPRPDSLVVGIGGAAAFSKASPAVGNLSSSASDQDDISFFWDDYLNSNVLPVPPYYGEQGNQTAREYSVQVATDPGFANVIDSATIDQATYTAGKELYPQGTIYWRVRAIDAQGNPLPWSAPASVTKSTPPSSLSAPVGGIAVSGGTPFEWSPQDFARSYTLEVYRNGDTAFSPGNRVLNVTTSALSYAPSTPLPANDTPYVWRVRKTDNSDNPGPWSPAATFRSLGAAPVLTSPTQDALVRSKAALLEWTDVPGAASYVVRATNGSKSYSIETVANAWAPSALEDGRWTWSVSARDAAEQLLGASSARDFRVDATAPKVTRLRPGKPKPTSTLVMKFSERIKGVSRANVKLTLKGAKGKKAKVKARVKLASTGTKATIDPKGKLKRGKTYILRVTAGATDVAGNALAPVKLTITIK